MTEEHSTHLRNLESFLKRNGPETCVQKENALYLAMLQDIAFSICEDIKQDFGKNKNNYLIDKELFLDLLLDHYTLTPFETKYIKKILKNYMTKDNSRDTSIRKAIANTLYERQNKQCRCCGKYCPSISDMDLDHIIPFRYVGDGRNIDEYQLLCKDCNNKKRDNPWFPIHYYLTEPDLKLPIFVQELSLDYEDEPQF